MSIDERRRAAGARNLRAMKKEIEEKFGEEVLGEAVRRLCNNCIRRKCPLYPLTTKGEDCPYFMAKGDRE